MQLSGSFSCCCSNFAANSAARAAFLASFSAFAASFFNADLDKGWPFSSTFGILSAILMMMFRSSVMSSATSKTDVLRKKEESYASLSLSIGVNNNCLT